MSDERQTHVVNVPSGTLARIELQGPDDDRGPGAPTGGWFRMWRSIIDSGSWANLSGAAAKVLPVLARYCDDWITRISHHTLSEKTGLSMPSVRRAMSELRKARVLIVRIDGRGRNCGEYQLIRPIQTGSKQITHDRLNRSPVSGLDRKQITHDSEKVSPVIASIYSETLSSETAAAMVPTRAAPVTGQRHAAAVHLLTRNGTFPDHEARELAELANGDLAVVRAALDRLTRQRDGRGLKGTAYGFVAAAIRGRWGASDATQVQANRLAAIDRQAAVRQNQREACRQEAEAIRDELKAIRAQLAGVPAEQIATLTARVLEGLPRFQRARLINGGYGVHNSATLARGVWALVRESQQSVAMAANG